MSRWDSVSITAHYTAQVWVRLGLPWAWRFDTRRGRLLHGAARPLFLAAARMGLTTPDMFCVQRHRMMDALLDEIAPAQVVELAGGLSPRCLACSQERGVPCLDADLPAMVSLKAGLVGTDAPASYRSAALDLVESRDYVEDLGPLLRPLAPTVVITEGILPYFDAGQRQHVFDQVAALLRRCGGGVYLTDMHHEESVRELGPLASAFRWGLHRISRTEQISLISCFADGRAMLERAGFREVIQHRPEEWRAALDLPAPRRSAGLVVYEARM